MPRTRYFFLNFSALAEERVKPLLNDTQWKSLQPWLEEFRHSHDALVFEEGRVVPGANDLVPAFKALRIRKKHK